jgi:hypothetical protein
MDNKKKIFARSIGKTVKTKQWVKELGAFEANSHIVDTGEYVITKGKEQKNINSLCSDMPVKPVKCEPFNMSSEMRKMIDGMIKDLDEQIKQLKK